MGYYSEVVIACGKQAKRLLDRVNRAYPITSNWQWHEDCECWYLQESLKWYDLFEDVKHWEKAMEHINEKHGGEPGWMICFHRLGEDFGDYERKYDYDDFQCWPRQTLDVF